MTKFDEIDGLPSAFLDIKAKDIAQLFKRPTLAHLPGPGSTLFVSILLHGNEDAGLFAVQDLLRRFPQGELPRGLSVFIGNIEACTANKRFLPGQVDYNRAWPGSELPPCETHELLAEVTDRMLNRGVFASIDIHNNTGRNPRYGCICITSPETVYLASLFSHRIVYFRRPKGVQTQAFMQHCPSVTCECGQIGDMASAAEAADFLEKCLYLHEIKPPEHLPLDMQVYHTVARIKIRNDCTFGFEPGADVVLRKDIDSLNFVALEAGEALGTLTTQLEDCFLVNDEDGRDVTEEYLTCASKQLVLGKSAMPSMLTRNVDVIRQDCLGYLMERLPIVL